MNDSTPLRATASPQSQTPLRIDLALIAEMIEPGSRVLDVGCGHGELLKFLEENKQVHGRGIELSQSGVNFCVAKGLSVVQGDADRDLSYYPDGAFDYAILSQTLQATQHPKRVLKELLRIGRRAVVSFPNFGNWRIRMQLLIHGQMPVTHALPDTWYETPNIHVCTIKDFLDLCKATDTRVERQVALDAYGYRLGRVPLFLQNLIGEQAVFLLASGTKPRNGRFSRVFGQTARKNAE